MTSNVTAGEGVESDDDSSLTPSFMKNTMVTSTMVSGEASETDEEDEEADAKKEDPYMVPMEAEEPLPLEGDDHVTLTTEMEDLKEESAAALEKKKTERAKRHKLVYKYDTPFHRKLREKNLQLRSDLVEGVSQVYKGAAMKLDTSYYHITKAQTSAQDIAYNTKIILEDLHSLGHIIRETVEVNYLSSLKVHH